MNIRHEIEFFHLVFCKLLLATQDKSLIVLKGGCNLRFFLGSNRYSEDIDFDIETIARETLRKRVDKLLASPTLATILATRKLALNSSSSPKQTDSVQRWKIALRAKGISIPTKVEFSRRGIDHQGRVFEPVNPLLLAEQKLSSVFLSHYNVAAAIIQKIEALAGRSHTQARDVFDLHLLFSRHPNIISQIKSKHLDTAISNAMSVDFDQFRGQVLEFLSDESHHYFAEKINWDSMQQLVVEALERINP